MSPDSPCQKAIAPLNYAWRGMACCLEDRRYGAHQRLAETQTSWAQVRSKAPDADIVVLNLPLNVLSPIRGQASSQMYMSALEQQVQELKGQGFQKLHLLNLPSSVMQVMPTCHERKYLVLILSSRGSRCKSSRARASRSCTWSPSLQRHAGLCHPSEGTPSHS